MTGQKNHALQLDQQLLLQLLQSANERNQKQQQLNGVLPTKSGKHTLSKIRHKESRFFLR
ncbi:hypothetical protein C8149_RS14370 [Enterococcus faecalis]|nr:hypothetical protein [Enterococcus faecalis]